jgi:multiple sugar transport system substrate-binding protein
MERDNLDLSDVLPSSIQALKDRGNGSLYGLAPTFNSRSLIYNKTLFDQYHISYPTDQMSWDEILNLAKQFPKSENEEARIYGFHEMYMSMLSPTYLIKMIANTNGLQFMNDKATQVTMDSEAWNHAFHLAIDGYQSGLLHKPATVVIKNNVVEKSDQLAMDLFTKGKAAMTLDTVEFYSRTTSKKLGFEVGVVTAPVSATQPNTSTFFQNGHIYAINAKSANPDAVWEIIKYINSEAVAKLYTQTNSGLTTHLSVLHDLKYPGLDDFYKLDSASSSLYDFPNHLKMDFAGSFNSIIEEEVAKVMNGKQTIDEAQVNIQQREQSNLDKANSE